MRRRSLLAAMLPLPAAAQTRSLSLSPANTTIAFSIGALGLFSLEGRFTRFAGALRLDTTLPEATRVAVLVDTASIEAEGGATDAARELDLLRTRDYPTLAYRSLMVTVGTEGSAQLRGLLTLAGVTRPLDLVVRREPDRFIATGVLERSSYGLTALRPILADRVQLSIAVRLPQD